MPTVGETDSGSWLKYVSLNRSDGACAMPRYLHKKFDCVWNVMAHGQKPDFVFRWNGRVHFNRRNGGRGRQFSRLMRSRGVRISGSNAGYTMFWGSVKGTGFPLHSPVSPSFPLPCFTVCHHISNGLYSKDQWWVFPSKKAFRVGSIAYQLRKISSPTISRPSRIVDQYGLNIIYSRVTIRTIFISKVHTFLCRGVWNSHLSIYLLILMTVWPCIVV